MKEMRELNRRKSGWRGFQARTNGTKVCLVYSRNRRKVHMPRAVPGWGKRSKRRFGDGPR